MLSGKVRHKIVRGLECSVCTCVCVCVCVCVYMHGDYGNIYTNGPCIALHRHNSSDLEPSPAQSLQSGHKHKATLLFPVYVCASLCMCVPLLQKLLYQTNVPYDYTVD